MDDHNSTDTEYITELRANRDEKDGFFDSHPQSPLSDSARETFDGLSYFEPDSSWRITATAETLDIDPDDDETDIAANEQQQNSSDCVEYEPVPMETSTGETVRYVRVVKFKFERGGTTHELIGYRQRPDDQDEALFVPFRDKTTGQETYAGGRYLELHPNRSVVDGSTVVIDFNLAYTPFCAYNDAFSCPRPPEENWLDIPVRAGEQDWTGDTAVFTE
jgi:Uncharacterized conserved protein